MNDLIKNVVAVCINSSHSFSKTIQNILNGKKLIALDVGAQGGFNSDNFFPSKYNNFFEDILPLSTADNII